MLNHFITSKNNNWLQLKALSSAAPLIISPDLSEFEVIVGPLLGLGRIWLASVCSIMFEY